MKKRGCQRVKKKGKYGLKNVIGLRNYLEKYYRKISICMYFRRETRRWSESQKVLSDESINDIIDWRVNMERGQYRNVWRNTHRVDGTFNIHKGGN